MGRVYTIPLNIGAHSTALDVCEFLAAAEKPFRLLGFELGQASEYGDAQEEVIPMLVRRVTASPTSGSGGATPTAQPVDPNATACAATIETGNPTVLTGGTSTELARVPWNVRGGTLWTPPPELWWQFAGGTRLVITEGANAADSITGPHGWIAIEELV